MRYFFIGLVIVWVIWASFSTGGFHELKQINPEYAHPDRNIANLLSKLEGERMIDSRHVEWCAFYMPNWPKANRCVKERIRCEFEVVLPHDRTREYFMFSDTLNPEYQACWEERKPWLGPMEWLRVSRALWRGGIGLGFLWIVDKLYGEGEEEWSPTARSWAEAILAWGKRAE
ncbi:hypothetical protein KDX31_05800 [Amphritea atlantica]|uniref:Uncharacterized protein n=1 Tax=Amphritea atlantica TaxID=355243 RepID=A0ABY5GZ19_9GAMM|nr:hypothetical protein KDX31_05800 [Amphritea atlantica]